ncbi:MAG TPA: ROK family protein, partial [Gemmatimonadaceae bacterium]|nr:ROK family protein [Gemmatimonadaceae bacterium]
SLWGIDLGGTKIEAVVIDSARPTEPRHRIRLETESDRGYDHIIERIRTAVERLVSATGLPRPGVIGVGTPGTTEPATGLLKNSNTVCLNGRPLGTDLAAALGVECRLANDANCFALAEASFGAAQGRDVVIGLILGTGVGSGIVVHGRALHGLHGIAGEWGHNPMRGEATPCYCGRAGCVETVISGPALERFYRERTAASVALPTIVARASAGDIDAGATLARLVAKFGEAIAAVINILDPDAIVIGGGVGNIDRLYAEETRAAIRRHLFNTELRTELLRPTLGDSAGVFGAALLARPLRPLGSES